MKEENNSPKNENSFTEHQRAMDEALNERAKEQNQDNEDEAIPRSELRNRKTDTSEKKGGSGKQSNPGD